MQTLYLMDRLINKPVKLNSVADQIFIKSWDKVIYKETNQNGQTVMAVGINLGYEVDTVKTGTFVEILDSNKVKQFEQYQQQALTYFPQFRKEFKQLFPDSTPITARSNILGDTVYFYFYAETRYNFSDFVKNFRNKINKRFFIYQVGARDMMRLHPESKLYLVDCGCGPMGCCGTWPLPTIEMETIALQWLEGRDVEKLKGRCGKLKCSLVFEQYLYEQEAKKFPRKWTVIRYGEKTGKCINYNILTQEVTIRTEEGDVIRAWLTDIDRSKHNTPTSEIITQTAV
jgi:cell fate regulator YaaT (PSP1 superfamily)